MDQNESFWNFRLIIGWINSLQCSVVHFLAWHGPDFLHTVQHSIQYISDTVHVHTDHDRLMLTINK